MIATPTCHTHLSHPVSRSRANSQATIPRLESFIRVKPCVLLQASRYYTQRGPLSLFSPLQGGLCFEVHAVHLFCHLPQGTAMPGDKLSWLPPPWRGTYCSQTQCKVEQLNAPIKSVEYHSKRLWYRGPQIR